MDNQMDTPAPRKTPKAKAVPCRCASCGRRVPRWRVNEWLCLGEGAEPMCEPCKKLWS